MESWPIFPGKPKSEVGRFNLKVLIVAGGTGGHFYPGLAVAKACMAEKDTVHFVIRQGDYVEPLLQREKIPYSSIMAAGLARRLTPKNISVPFKTLGGFVQSLVLLQRIKPDHVVVMGGYLSFPVSVAAWLLRIPVLLHEQNAVPGLANRMLSHFARKIALSFSESSSYFGAKGQVTGNPVRPEFTDLPSVTKSRLSFGFSPMKPTFLVFGGSLGAQRLNRLSSQALTMLVTEKFVFQVLHFTGAADEKEIRDVYAKAGVAHHVMAYSHDMPMAYSAADLVICRAGASTISELIAVKRPAILVPYPLATGGHQTANARVLVGIGAAECYEQKDLTPERMRDILKSYLTSPERLTSMTKRFSTLSWDLFGAAREIRRMLETI